METKDKRGIVQCKQKNKEQLKKQNKLPIQNKIEEQKKEIEHEILLMKFGIKIAEDSVDEGNKELEACLKV